MSCTVERIDGLLNMLLPPLIVEQLTEAGPDAALPSHRYTCATVAQSDLVGFTQLASTRTAREVVNLQGEVGLMISWATFAEFQSNATSTHLHCEQNDILSSNDEHPTSYLFLIPVRLF